ncbi:MAG: hypothetical protein D6698_15160 [Gammaproteobacteria bacterium]|nr:MAG: hypothetical protein D6698_15160 [Gammaproteobacteria bacterium]
MKHKPYGWAVEQYGYGIFGIGKTKKEALLDANEWVGPGEKLDPEEVHGPDHRVDGDFRFVLVTKEVYDLVEQGYGDRWFDEDEDGVLYVDNE